MDDTHAEIIARHADVMENIEYSGESQFIRLCCKNSD